MVPATPSWTGAPAAPRPTPAPPPPPVSDSLWTRHHGWVIALASFIVVVLIAGSAAVAAMFMEVPYAITEPGSAWLTNDRVTVDGHPTYPPAGEVYFVTVTTDVHVTRLEKFQADRNPDVEVQPREEELRGLTPEEDTRLNLLSMTQSKDRASIVAMQKLGYDVGARTTGAVIQSIAPDSPSHDKLPLFSVIVAVGGTPVADVVSLRAELAKHTVGETVAIRVEDADGSQTDVPITLGANPDNGNPYLGIVPEDRLAYELPFQVTIDSRKVGGPSAGLAYTLEILDVLTDGELTGGRRVAVTGTIELDGSVGAIGGVRQKVVAVRRAGIDTFLVPADNNCGEEGGSCNYTEAKAKAGDKVTIVPVSTLDEALQYLSTVGGNGLALGTPGATETAGG